MRSLSSTLLAAQRGASSLPHLKVEADESLPGVAHPLFSRLYTGVEPAWRHAAHMPGDGSLIRARVDVSDERLYVQRVVSPGPASDFSQWTHLDDAGSHANIVLCGRGNQVLLFYVDKVSESSIRYRESGNNGASWGAEKTVLTVPEDQVSWLAASVSGPGTPVVFYATDDHVVHVTKRVGGDTWANPSTWPHNSAVDTVKGMASVYSQDWLLTVCGQASGGEEKIWTTIYGDGGLMSLGEWSPLEEVTRAEGSAGIDFTNPFMHMDSMARLFLVERSTGSPSYNRPLWSFSAPGSSLLDCLWREPAPFNLDTAFGMAITGDAGNLWLSTHNGVWRGVLHPAPDLTGDVLSADLRDVAEGGGGVVTLRNDDGRYNSPGTGGLVALRKGSRIRVSPGT